MNTPLLSGTKPMRSAEEKGLKCTAPEAYLETLQIITRAQRKADGLVLVYASSKQLSHLPGMNFKNLAYPFISKPQGSFTFLLGVANLIKPEYDISAAARKCVLEHF